MLEQYCWFNNLVQARYQYCSEVVESTTLFDPVIFLRVYLFYLHCIFFPQVVVPLKYIKEIPEGLRSGLVEQLTALPQSNTVLGEIATRILQKRVYVDNAFQFMETIKEMKIRLLFRELKKENKAHIITWMRRNFPAGSTGQYESWHNA